MTFFVFTHLSSYCINKTAPPPFKTFVTGCAALFSTTTTLNITLRSFEIVTCTRCCFVSHRIRNLWSVGQLRAEFGGRRKIGRRHVEMGEVQECQHGDGQHFEADSQTQSYILVQKTPVPRSVHGLGRSRRKGIVVPSGAARPPVRPVPSDRQRSGSYKHRTRVDVVSVFKRAVDDVFAFVSGDVDLFTSSSRTRRLRRRYHGISTSIVPLSSVQTGDQRAERGRSDAPPEPTRHDFCGGQKILFKSNQKLATPSGYHLRRYGKCNY